MRNIQHVRNAFVCLLVKIVQRVKNDTHKLDPNEATRFSYIILVAHIASTAAYPIHGIINPKPHSSEQFRISEQEQPIGRADSSTFICPHSFQTGLRRRRHFSSFAQMIYGRQECRLYVALRMRHNLLLSIWH